MDLAGGRRVPLIRRGLQVNPKLNISKSKLVGGKLFGIRLVGSLLFLGYFWNR